MSTVRKIRPESRSCGQTMQHSTADVFRPNHTNPPTVHTARMNILEIAGSGGIGNSYMGPVTRVIAELSREFSDLGLNVSVVDSKGFSPRIKFPHGVNLIELDIESGFKVFNRLKKANRFWAQMVPERVGCLVEPKDCSDLTNKILYLARNSDILDAMRRNCRNFVEKQFSWRCSAKRHIEAFEELIQISQTPKIKAHFFRKFTAQSGCSPTSPTKRLPDSV